MSDQNHQCQDDARDSGNEDGDEQQSSLPNGEGGRTTPEEEELDTMLVEFDAVDSQLDEIAKVLDDFDNRNTDLVGKMQSWLEQNKRDREAPSQTQRGADDSGSGKAHNSKNPDDSDSNPDH